MRDLKARDVDVPFAARLVRPDQRVGAVAQFLLEIGERIPGIAGDRPLPELFWNQAFEQRRLGAAEIAGLREARRRDRECDQDRQAAKATSLALAALAARRGRARLQSVGRRFAMPLDADHRQDNDAAPVAARFGQPVPTEQRSAGNAMIVPMSPSPGRLALAGPVLRTIKG